MKSSGHSHLWQFKEASAVKPLERFILLVWVLTGILAIVRFANWWFKGVHVNNVTLYVLLSVVMWYSILRLMLIWINYLRVAKPLPQPAREGLRVAIFTTSSPGEPLAMFEKTLAACKGITYPHTTYLLDDTRDAAFKEVAERNGAVWLELVGLPGAKAGKINRALQLTDEDFILVLDPDHVPFPNFLDHTLGFFEDPKVGYVQVSQAYYNQYRSFTALGAAEQTYTFYGPTQMSLFGYGCSVAIGANCTFRRKALESVGGRGIGLAEDLITAIRLHAAGWKSIYNPVVVSRGLVPEDFGSFCKQQLKWARGVFEVTFQELPRLFKKLTFWQRVSYFMIGTYYLNGATQFAFTLIPFIFFVTGMLPATMEFSFFISHGLPIVVMAIVIYLYVQRWMCDPETERGLHWRGMVLKCACWPIYFFGFLLSLIDAKIPYIPTAKKAVTGYFTPFARPLVMQIAAFVSAVAGIIVYRRYFMVESDLGPTAERTWGMIGFAFISFVMAMGGIYAAYEATRMKEEDPWDTINLAEIKTNS
jgi:cellulose synthase (UDP-forming)